jgi:hypothetical protein
MYQMKKETCWNYFKNGGRGIKENDGGVNLTEIYCKHFCKCHKVPLVQEVHDKKKMKDS